MQLSCMQILIGVDVHAFTSLQKEFCIFDSMTNPSLLCELFRRRSIMAIDIIQLITNHIHITKNTHLLKRFMYGYYIFNYISFLLEYVH